MTIIRFDSAFPKENLSAVSELLEKHRQLIPDWCNWLTIYFADEDQGKGFTLETVVNYDYRFAQIYVYAAWLVSRDREHEMVHELFHIITAPASNSAYTRT